MHIHYHEQSSSVVFLTSVLYELFCHNLWTALVLFFGCVPLLLSPVSTSTPSACILFCILSFLPFSPVSFHLPLPLSSVIPPIIYTKGQAACPCPHTHSRRVQERLCSRAPEIQQGTELLLLHGDTTDLQCETNINMHIHNALQL